eukprot:m.165665 g.165665  ORF g.165665 m.165665 type:complete len:62 (-) comp17741_c2_seq1:358-543(-)
MLHTTLQHNTLCPLLTTEARASSRQAAANGLVHAGPRPDVRRRVGCLVCGWCTYSGCLADY